MATHDKEYSLYKNGLEKSLNKQNPITNSKTRPGREQSLISRAAILRYSKVSVFNKKIMKHAKNYEQFTMK